MTNDNAKTWEENCMDEAIKLASDINSTFRFRLEQASKALPEDDAKHRGELFNCFMDGLIGAIVMIGANTVGNGSSTQFEEAVITNLRDKFAHIRTHLLADRLGVVPKREIVNLSKEIH
jgi:hypothetical protein